MTLVMKKFMTCLSWKPKRNRKPRFFLQNLPKPTDRKHFGTVTTLPDATNNDIGLSSSRNHNICMKARHHINLSATQPYRSRREKRDAADRKDTWCQSCTRRGRDELSPPGWTDTAPGVCFSAHLDFAVHTDTRGRASHTLLVTDTTRFVLNGTLITAHSFTHSVTNWDKDM